MAKKVLMDGLSWHSNLGLPSDAISGHPARSELFALIEEHDDI